MESLLGYQLRRAANWMQADLTRRLSAAPLTIIEASVLLVIEANPGVTQSEIGRMLAIKRGNMAPIAVTLEARGLIDRLPVDGRSSGLRLTAAGARAVQAARQSIEENERQLWSNTRDAERDAALDLLRRIWADNA